MSFLSPLSLLLFLPLGGIIVLLYLLKMKRKERTVSSVMLWRDAIADLQANAPFQKLKKSLLLFLQLAILVLLVCAIARPCMKVRDIKENRMVVILDSSASMRAIDVSPSRFEAAKSQALDIVSKMGHDDTMLVITAGAKAKVISPFTSDKSNLSSDISKLKAADNPCNMRQAILLGLSLASGKSTTPAQIIVLSDGGFTSLDDISAGNAKIDFMRIGERSDNVGITGISTRKSPSGEQQVFLGLQNFSDKERIFNLEIYLGEQLIDIRKLMLPPKSARQEILEDISNISGRLTVKLDISDDLSVDNTGTVYLSGPKPVRVLLVSKGNVFLQNALNLDKYTELAKTESFSPDIIKSDYNLVVFDGVSPPDSLPPGSYLLIDVETKQSPAKLGKPIDRPPIIDSSKMHPVSMYADFSDVQILQAHDMELKPWATTLVEGVDGPLVVAGKNEGYKIVQLSWNMLDSNFPLRIGFPIFIANCIDWLAADEFPEGGLCTRAGRPVQIDVPPDAKQITITRPDGVSETLIVTQTPIVYDDTSYVGVYKVSGTELEKEFACNLTSTQESDLSPKDAFTIGEKSFKSKDEQVRTNREYWWPIVLMVLALLALEWYAYHRRL